MTYYFQEDKVNQLIDVHKKQLAIQEGGIANNFDFDFKEEPYVNVVFKQDLLSMTLLQVWASQEALDVYMEQTREINVALMGRIMAGGPRNEVSGVVVGVAYNKVALVTVATSPTLGAVWS